MAQLLLVLVGALVVGAIGFGIAALIFGGDPGLVPTEPDGQAVPLPRSRPLVEADIARVRFDTGLRGYRMAQVDAALGRAAYDVGYKEELINVLEAEVAALRDGRLEDADVLRRAREAAMRPASRPEVSAPGKAMPVDDSADADAGDAAVPVDAAATAGKDADADADATAGKDAADTDNRAADADATAGDHARQREQTRLG